jgi:superfamily II DNA or RNA helicase
LKVVCAPRILDEGIDVPEAELAIIVAASKSRRQMIQRMGRVIRLKRDGRPARILLTYVRGTSEDPAYGGHEAFLDEVVPYALSSSVLDGKCTSQISEWLKTAENDSPDNTI